MRAPYQILALPYRVVNGKPMFCVFHRADCDAWQFISGGVEEGEAPYNAAIREIFEEGGVKVDHVTVLQTRGSLPTSIYPNLASYNWPLDVYVVPEYAFAFECKEEITISHEHTEYRWLSYDEAYEILTWDSNRTAMYEVCCRLRHIHGWKSIFGD